VVHSVKAEDRRHIPKYDTAFPVPKLQNAPIEKRKHFSRGIIVQSCLINRFNRGGADGLIVDNQYEAMVLINPKKTS